MIKIENLSLAFEGKKIYDGFNLEIKKGEKILLEGRSGSGKSTLLKIILGFENNYTGNLYFEGEKIDKRNIWGIRHRSSYVAQNLDIGEGNIRNFINEVFALKANKGKSFSEKELEEYLNTFELKMDILGKNIEELSGGERQRIAVVVSLLLKREIFLLDEPTASLDGRLKEKVADYFMKNSDITVIAVSHDEIWRRDGIRRIKIGEGD